MRNSPISKELLQNSTYYVPVFKNEKLWQHINTNSWFDCLYYTYMKQSKSTDKTKICGIDIGVKNFLSIYGVDGTCYKIKSNFQIIDDILRNKKLDYLIKDIMIKNLIDDLHYKAAYFICRNFDVIYIGYVNNNGDINSRNMNSIKDNLLKILCQTQFLCILKKVAKRHKKILQIVDESFTSIQCTKCGETNPFPRILKKDNSERRKYTCNHCQTNVCRDIGASRSIIIKNEHNKQSRLYNDHFSQLMKYVYTIGYLRYIIECPSDEKKKIKKDIRHLEKLSKYYKYMNIKNYIDKMLDKYVYKLVIHNGNITYTVHIPICFYEYMRDKLIH